MATITIGGVSEQDLDLFFLEEVVANIVFRDWLLSKVPGWPEGYIDLIAAARSIKHADGEVDLAFTFADSSGRRARLMVENKVNAGFQPTQLARYAGRAADLRRSGEFAHVAAALLAPDAYTSASVGKIEAVVSYEAVEAWILDQIPDTRTPYKLQLLRTAIKKQGTGYNPDSDQPVTDFWNAYWRKAVSVAPELEMMQPGGKPSGSAFVWFACPDLPAGLNICHKLEKGFVDLHFPGLGSHAARLRAALESLIEPPMDVARANKSAAVRIIVPRLKTVLPFAEQEDHAQQGLDAAKTLRDWARRNSSRLSEIETLLRA